MFLRQFVVLCSGNIVIVITTVTLQFLLWSSVIKSKSVLICSHMWCSKTCLKQLYVNILAFRITIRPLLIPDVRIGSSACVKNLKVQIKAAWCERTPVGSANEFTFTERTDGRSQDGRRQHSFTVCCSVGSGWTVTALRETSFLFSAIHLPH